MQYVSLSIHFSEADLPSVARTVANYSSYFSDILRLLSREILSMFLLRKYFIMRAMPILDQVCLEISATRSRTLFDLIFWLEDHFGSHKNFGSREVSAAFAKYVQMFNSGGKHKFSVLRN